MPYLAVPSFDDEDDNDAREAWDFAVSFDVNDLGDIEILPTSRLFRDNAGYAP